MDLVVLAGNHVFNRGWINKVESELRDLFDHTHVVKYHHWQTKSEMIDIDYEISRLSKLVTVLPKYVVLAKSAGVVLTLKAISQRVINPVANILLGTPLHWAKAQGFSLSSLLSNYNIPTLFFQNRDDPIASSQELEDWLVGLNLATYHLTSLSGRTHIR